MIAVDPATLPWEARFNEKLGRALHRKNLVTDPTPVWRSGSSGAPRGVTNVRRPHPCGRGMYVLEGTLVTHAVRFGTGCFVLVPDGTVMEQGAAADGAVSVLFIANKLFEVHYLEDRRGYVSWARGTAPRGK